MGNKKEWGSLLYFFFIYLKSDEVLRAAGFKSERLVNFAQINKPLADLLLFWIELQCADCWSLQKRYTLSSWRCNLLFCIWFQKRVSFIHMANSNEKNLAFNPLTTRSVKWQEAFFFVDTENCKYEAEFSIKQTFNTFIVQKVTPFIDIDFGLYMLATGLMKLIIRICFVTQPSRKNNPCVQLYWTLFPKLAFKCNLKEPLVDSMNLKQLVKLILLLFMALPM